MEAPRIRLTAPRARTAHLAALRRTRLRVVAAPAEATSAAAVVAGTPVVAEAATAAAEAMGTTETTRRFDNPRPRLFGAVPCKAVDASVRSRKRSSRNYLSFEVFHEWRHVNDSAHAALDSLVLRGKLDRECCYGMPAAVLERSARHEEIR